MLDRLGHRFYRCDKLLGWIDVDRLSLLQDLTREGIDLGDALNRIAPELDAHGRIAIGRKHVYRVSTDAEGASLKTHIVAVIVSGHQVAQHRVAAPCFAQVELYHLAPVFVRRTKAINGRHAGDNDHVASCQQCLHRCQAQLVDLLVDIGILLDVRVRSGEVRLGLVVVIVGDIVFNGVMRKELAKLGIELRGQGLVVHQHKRRSLHPFHHLGDGIGLTSTRRTQQSLVLKALFQAFDQQVNGLRLVASWFEIGDHLKLGHGLPLLERKFALPLYLASHILSRKRAVNVKSSARSYWGCSLHLSQTSSARAPAITAMAATTTPVNEKSRAPIITATANVRTFAVIAA